MTSNCNHKVPSPNPKSSMKGDHPTLDTIFSPPCHLAVKLKTVVEQRTHKRTDEATLEAEPNETCEFDAFDHKFAKLLPLSSVGAPKSESSDVASTASVDMEQDKFLMNIRKAHNMWDKSQRVCSATLSASAGSDATKNSKFENDKKILCQKEMHWTQYSRTWRCFTFKVSSFRKRKLGRS